MFLWNFICCFQITFLFYKHIHNVTIILRKCWFCATLNGQKADKTFNNTNIKVSTWYYQEYKFTMSGYEMNKTTHFSVKQQQYVIQVVWIERQKAGFDASKWAVFLILSDLFIYFIFHNQWPLLIILVKLSPNLLHSWPKSHNTWNRIRFFRPDLFSLITNSYYCN